MSVYPGTPINPDTLYLILPSYKGMTCSELCNMTNNDESSKMHTDSVRSRGAVGVK